MRARATTEKANQEVPIPKGNTAYAKAKRAEYLEKYFKLMQILTTIETWQKRRNIIA
jgi:hypothetical protein